MRRARANARRARLALLASAVISLNVARAEPTTSGRWHFAFEDAPPFELSVLFERGEAGDRTRLLVETGGRLYELGSRQDPTGRDSTESIRDVASGEAISRRLLLSRYQDVAACKAVAPPDACVVFTGRNGDVATSLGALAGEDAARLRERLVALATLEMRGRLVTLAPLFGRSPEFDAYGRDFLGLLWPDLFTGRRATASRGTRRPGCDFDAAFGHPCTEAERQREARRFAQK